MANLRSIFLPWYPANPYQKLLSEHLQYLGVHVELADTCIFSLPIAILKWKADILHLHWLEPFYLAAGRLKSLAAMIMFFSTLVFLKLIGVKIVWTVHNIKNHENEYPKIDRACSTLVAWLANAIIVHCISAKEKAALAFSLRNTKKIFVVPHGNYCNFYENNIRQGEARRALGLPLSSFVLLFIGMIRPYKGVLNLIETFKVLRKDDTHLLIAGTPANKELVTLIKREIDGHDNITFKPGFLPDDQIQIYLNACDAVVFPYHDVLTSGAVILGMSFGKVCIAPRVGCINDVLDETGSFLYDPETGGGLLQAINEAYERRSDLLSMGAHNQRLAEQFDWNCISEMTLDIYQWCMNKDY